MNVATLRHTRQKGVNIFVLKPSPTPRCGRRSGLARQGGDGLVVADTG